MEVISAILPNTSTFVIPGQQIDQVIPCTQQRCSDTKRIGNLPKLIPHPY